jgi:hypothetical protein
MRLPGQRSALKRSFLSFILLIITFFCSLHKESAKIVNLQSIAKRTAQKFHGIKKNVPTFYLKRQHVLS